MKILNIVESAYRATLEEQDDTILWLSAALKGAGARLAILLRANAVNYIVHQECPALRIGSAGVNHPARPDQDIARLQEKGVRIYAVRDDAEERGIELKNIIPGIHFIRRSEIANLMEEHDHVWHW